MFPSELYQDDLLKWIPCGFPSSVFWNLKENCSRGSTECLITPLLVCVKSAELLKNEIWKTSSKLISYFLSHAPFFACKYVIRSKNVPFLSILLSYLRSVIVQWCFGQLCGCFQSVKDNPLGSWVEPMQFMVSWCIRSLIPSSLLIILLMQMTWDGIMLFSKVKISYCMKCHFLGLSSSRPRK